MAEKIERMELDSDSKDKVCSIEMFFLTVLSRLLHLNENNYVLIFDQHLMELQELYSSQQLLTEELSDKLEKTEV